MNAATESHVVRFLSRLDNVEETSNGWQCCCPAHDDSTASLSLAIGSENRLLLKCFAGCKPDAIVEAVGLTLADLFAEKQTKTVAEIIGKGKKKIVAEYDYLDAGGALLYQVVRFDPKDFRQRKPDGDGDWTYKLNGVRRVLYKLPELIKARPGEIIYITEGEKDADRLAELGLIATTSPQGAGKWDAAYNEPLRNRNVVCLPDNDDAGRKHMSAVAESVHTVATSVRIVYLPALPPKGDVSDWIDSGGTPEVLLKHVAAAPEWKPFNADDDPPDAILNDVHRFLGRFIAYPSEAARIAHMLWIIHTHLMDEWETTPRLALLSPEPGCGKSRLMEITALLVPNPLVLSNVSAAYLFRRISDQENRPTLMIDEVDTVFGFCAGPHEDLRGLINSGHHKDGIFARCSGDKIEPKEYPVYAAIAMAARMREYPDTITSRSVLFRMRRRRPEQKVNQYRPRKHAREGHAIRDRLAAWCATLTDIGDLDRVQVPAGIEDRNADVWEPLLAIADAAGTDWPERAREAALWFVNTAASKNVSNGVRLLSDIRDIFNGRDFMRTSDILAELCGVEESPWAEINKGKPLTARKLSQWLGEYDVSPDLVRLGKERGRGYHRSDFKDAWERYLPPESVTSVTPVTTSKNAGENGTLSGRVTDCGTVQSVTPAKQEHGKAQKTLAGTDVTDVTVPQERGVY